MSARHLPAISALAAAVIAALALGGCASGAGAGTASAGSGDGTVTDGKFTVATGEPAYYPWVIDDAPESGEGFEAAVAYAVAGELGYEEDDVVWVRNTFEESIAPGPKDFDVNLQQFSITDERREAVDFSSPYYETSQVVITVEGSAAEDAGSIADLAPLLIGAQTGTTSLTAVETVIQPESGAQVFNTNDDAKLALENGAVDAIVVDLPTAFFLTGVELTGGIIVGQLPQDDATVGDRFGLVLAKDSPLTAEVTDAVDALRDSGRLQEIADQWLADAGDAPVLQ